MTEPQWTSIDVMMISDYMKGVDMEQFQYITMQYNWLTPEHFTIKELNRIIKCLKELEDNYDDGRVPKAFDFSSEYEFAHAMIEQLANCDQ